MQAHLRLSWLRASTAPPVGRATCMMILSLIAFSGIAHTGRTFAQSGMRSVMVKPSTTPPHGKKRTGQRINSQGAAASVAAPAGSAPVVGSLPVARSPKAASPQPSPQPVWSSHGNIHQGKSCSTCNEGHTNSYGQQAYAQPIYSGETSCCGEAGFCGEAGCCEEAFYSCCTLPGKWFWAQGEFLLWWRSGIDLPPLVATNALPEGQILFGNEGVGDGERPGGRVTLGMWIDECEVFGLEGRFFALGTQNTRFNSRDLGNIALGIPFLQVGGGQLGENLVIVNDPNAVLGDEVTNGEVEITTESDVLGGEVFLRCPLARGCNKRIDIIGGYQGSRIDESVAIRQAIVQQLNPDTTINIDALDVFETRNEFHGGLVGLIGEFEYGCWTFTALGKVGLGNMDQSVDIRGLRRNPTPANAGLFALSSNSGFFRRDQFSAVPEVNLTLSYQMTPHLQWVTGYSYIHWSNVVRPGDQIDRAINAALIPGSTTPGDSSPARPRFRFDNGDFSLFGVHFGVRLSY